MKLLERWPLCAKWFVVLLVFAPMALLFLECCRVSSVALSVVAGLHSGLCVWLVDRVFFPSCQRRK
ncbi:hypothetical protein B6440_13470 [Salmonella enterica]|nr:hypothetical protein [Salmonella enterica subsp. diarizonae]EAA8945616.1 hypothetical protein [Salmonella enterica]EBR3877785.1 hypothetical protein [Salmonella enterica subsp. arizonae]EAO8182204.1 hypothetical protein [Salmonella enterica]EAZ3127353.1 hypothetical protein [Salmonella enterica]